MTKQTAQAVLQRKIGSTVYNVRIYTRPDTGETIHEKVLRLIKNDLKLSARNATMEPLQADWLPERSSL